MYDIADPISRGGCTSPSSITMSIKEEEASPSVPKRHIPTLSFNFSSPSSPSSLSDYIGSESCIDLQHDDGDDVQVQMGASLYSGVHHSKRDKHCGHDDKIEEFPPPIPLLARTENLPSHMPWILRRNYTSDGRLILTEEKVRHHEYFRAYRGDGRLRLQLIPLHDDEEDNVLDNVGFEEDAEVFVTNEEEDGDEKDTEHDDEGINKIKEELRQIVVDELALNKSAALENETSVIMGSSGTPKCLNLNMASSPSCLFGMPVPAARTVPT